MSVIDIISRSLTSLTDIELSNSAPLRPRASPRYTPADSVSSTPSALSDDDRAEAKDNDSSQGRRFFRPRMISIVDSQASVSSLHSKSVRREARLKDEGFCVPPIEMNELCSKRPFPAHNRTSWASDSTRSSVDELRFLNHRDTFALLGRSQPLRRLPESIFQLLATQIDFKTYLSLRLTCRYWSAAISQARPLSVPPVFNISPEILQQIYKYMDPNTFDAARHTCHIWMLASLNYDILAETLRRGGWWKAAKADVVFNNQSGEGRGISEEWLLSKRIATECRLQQNWAGNGLGHENSRSLLSRSETYKSSLSGKFSCLSPFRPYAEIDFPQLSREYNSTNSDQPDLSLRFVISACSRYLIVIKECAICVYFIVSSSANSRQHGRTHLTLLTSKLCPHRVLEVSVDISAARLAIAALLEGQVGLVYEIQEQLNSRQSRISPAYPEKNRLSIYNDEQRSVNVWPSPTTQPTAIQEPRLEFPIASDLQSGHICCQFSLGPETNAFRSLTPLNLSRTSPLVESSVTSIYSNLCSLSDPPSSIAVCIARRCVAFGCHAGVELRWIDDSAGNGWGTWVSLPSPSDFLYFAQPLKQGQDLEREFRLLSSQRYSRAAKTPTAGDQADLYQDSNQDGGLWQGGSNLKNSIQLCGVIPVDNGRFLLFINPRTRKLCLGNPHGTEILFVFEPPPPPPVNPGRPKTQNSGPLPILPTVYKAAAEITRGIRIVAAFGPDLWLYSVPRDWIETIHIDDPRLLEHETNIHAARVGQLDDLADAGVLADGGGVVVWAVATSGIVTLWTLSGGREIVAQQHVGRDGQVRWSRSESDAQADDDGGVPVSDQDRLMDIDIDINGGSVVNADPLRDADGDVLMRDVELGWEDDDGDDGQVYGDDFMDEGYFSE